jgi:hypothetical protein
MPPSEAANTPTPSALSDLDYLAQIRDRLAAILDAALGWITEEPKPEAIQSLETLQASQLRTAELVAGLRPLIGLRLVALAQRHGLPNPESWGLPFVSELSDPGEDDAHQARRFMHRVAARLHALHRLLDYLRPEGPETAYRRLARTLLGVDELDEPPFLPLTVHNVDDARRRNVGDLTDRDDQHLAALLGISPGEWGELNGGQRIGRMEAALCERTNPAGANPALSQPNREPQGELPVVPALASEATHALLSAPDLARQLGMGEARVESALRRYRKKYPDCYVETEPGGRRRNEPKYLYRAGDVVPLLKDLRDRS